MKLNKVEFTETNLSEALIGVLIIGAKTYSVFVRNGNRGVKKVSCTRVAKHDSLVVTVGRLNFAERELLKRVPEAKVFCRMPKAKK